MKLTPKRWLERIRRSHDLQKERKEEAMRFLRAYAGDYNKKPRETLDGDRDEAFVNFIFAYVETVRPTLLPGTPKAFSEALDPASEPQVQSSGAVVNHFARVLGAKKEFRKVIHDWFFGHAGILSDWDYSEEPSYKENGDPEIDPESITEETPEGEQAFKILKDRPTIRRINPWDMVWDCDSNSTEEHRWRGYRMALTWSEFKALPGISKEIRKKIRPKTLPKDMSRSGEDSASSAEKNWVVLWRVYDLENMCTKLIVDNESVEDFVEDLPWPWELDVGGDKFPLTILESKIDYNHPYPFSQFKAYWGQLQEKNALRTIAKGTVRRNAPGWFAKKGAMDEEQKEKFTGSKIGEYIEANFPDQVIAKPKIELPNDFHIYDAKVAEDTVDVSGLIEYRADSSGGTATEASIQNNKSSVRKGEAKSDFNDFVAIVFTKILQLCQQFLTEEQAVRIRTPDGPEDYQWLNVNRDKLQGNFHLTVRPDTDVDADEALRKQQDMKTLEVLGNNPHADQRKLAVIAARMLGREPEEVLLPEAEARANIAAQQAAEAGNNSQVNEKPKPLIDFSAIKVELLAPNVQAMIIAAALKMNEVPQTLQGSEGGALPAGVGDPASTSLSNAAPSQSVLPGAELNQAPPPMPGADMPPATPVNPASEMQGGKK